MAHRPEDADIVVDEYQTTHSLGITFRCDHNPPVVASYTIDFDYAENADAKRAVYRLLLRALDDRCNAPHRNIYDLREETIDR